MLEQASLHLSYGQARVLSEALAGVLEAELVVHEAVVALLGCSVDVLGTSCRTVRTTDVEVLDVLSADNVAALRLVDWVVGDD